MFDSISIKVLKFYLKRELEQQNAEGIIYSIFTIQNFNTKIKKGNNKQYPNIVCDFIEQVNHKQLIKYKNKSYLNFHDLKKLNFINSKEIPKFIKNLYDCGLLVSKRIDRLKIKDDDLMLLELTKDFLTVTKKRSP